MCKRDFFALGSFLIQSKNSSFSAGRVTVLSVKRDSIMAPHFNVNFNYLFFTTISKKLLTDIFLHGLELKKVNTTVMKRNKTFPRVAFVCVCVYVYFIRWLTV